MWARAAGINEGAVQYPYTGHIDRYRHTYICSLQEVGCLGLGQQRRAGGRGGLAFELGVPQNVDKENARIIQIMHVLLVQ
jgi:hypothetical protein